MSWQLGRKRGLISGVGCPAVTHAPRLKQALGDLIRSDTYPRAPGGTVDDRGTRASSIASIIAPYRAAAMKIISADPVVRKAMYERQMNTAAAYAAGSPNPTPANRTAETLGNIGRAFGVDLGASSKRKREG